MRESKGLSQAEVAVAIGISPRNYQRYEAGFFPKFRSEKIKALDQLLGTKIYDVLYDTTPDDNKQLFADIKAKKKTADSAKRQAEFNEVQKKYIKLLEEKNAVNLVELSRHVEASLGLMKEVFRELQEHRQRTEPKQVDKGTSAHG